MDAGTLDSADGIRLAWRQRGEEPHAQSGPPAAILVSGSNASGRSFVNAT